MQILILRSGDQFGPYSEEQARQYLRDGTLSFGDLAWHDGLDAWSTLAEVLNLPLSKNPPPPPPTTALAKLTSWRIKPHAKYYLGGLVLVALVYLVSPYVTAYSLQRALQQGNQSVLESDIDFPSVQTSLKEQLNAEVTKVSGGNIVASLASLLVHPAIDHTVDFYITPSGIATLAVNPNAQLPGESISMTSIKKVIATILGLNGRTPKSQGFVSPGEFVVDTGEAKLHLHFWGLGWKLKEIELTPSFNLDSYLVN